MFSISISIFFSYNQAYLLRFGHTKNLFVLLDDALFLTSEQKLDNIFSKKNSSIFIKWKKEFPIS
jgi:hypothetical protein